jgi:histidinol-phosphate phosphatase family protein
MTLANLARVRGAVSNDSGALHLAQAAGVPVVGIYGSTSPTWTGPVGDAQRVVYDAIDCSPCFSNTCPTAIECLTRIDAVRVFRVLTELVGLPDQSIRRGRPAVFLDRDGTILEPVPYIHDPAQVALIPGVADGLRSLQGAGFALVVVTNQSAVARKIVDRDQLRRIHERMEALLEEKGVRLDGIEICSHHPDFTGPCLCRKPEPGMIRRAAHRLALDLSRSFMIGDSISDLEAGRRAGVIPVLVRTGYGRESESALGAWSLSPSSEESRVSSESSGAAESVSPSSVAVFDSLRDAAVWVAAQT